MKFLGIDIGTSFIKAAVLDLDKNQIKKINRQKAPVPKTDSGTLRKEYDIGSIVDIVKHLIKEYSSLIQTIDGIVFSTQMHGFVLMDSNFEPVTNYISWEDERGLEKYRSGPQTYLDIINKRLSTENIKKTGMAMKPGLAVVNLFHWINNNKITNGEYVYFCTLGDYIISQLAGEEPYTHITNAAASGMVNLETGNWNQKIIEKLSLKKIKFPEIINERKAAGYVKINRQKAPLYPALGDHQAAILGVMLTPEKDISINIGTGSQISLIEEELNYGDYENRPFPGNKFLSTVTHIPGGRALDVLVGFIKDIGNMIYGIENLNDKDIWLKIMDAVTNCDNTDLDVNVSFFAGLTIPYDGSIKNIKVSNLTIDNLFLGAFNKMAQYYYEILQKMLHEKQVEKIIFSGGVARKNMVLRELIKKRIELPTELAPFKEDSLVGLFQLALVCSGICNNYQETGDYSQNLQIVR